MTTDVRSDLLAMLAAVDPSTVGQPRYIVDVAEHPGRFELRNAVGVTGPMAWSTARPFISNYRGPGFCTVVNSACLPSRWELDSVVAHEFAHHIVEGEAGLKLYARLSESTQAAARQDAATSTCRESGITTIAAPSTRRPWDGHGPDFVRVLLHICYRAFKRGWRAWMADAYALHETYLMPSGDAFSAALGDEIVRLADCPLAEVAATDPPAEYTEFSAVALADAERRFQLSTEGATDV